MRRNKLYIVIAIMTTLSLFITAATCSFCGIQPDTVLSEEESYEDKITSEPQSETSRSTQEQDSETARSSNNPPVIKEIELGGAIDVEFLVEAGSFDNVPSAEYEEAEHLFTIAAYDEDGDELTYRAYDSLGTNFDVTKVDNNNAEFMWINPAITGPYTLTIEVSDGRNGVDIYSIDMNITDEYFTNNPPEITGTIIITGPSGGAITADYVYTRQEYELRIEASDPDGHDLYYEWRFDGSNCGTISNTTANPTTWRTPVEESGQIIDEWCYIIISVSDAWGGSQRAERRVHVVTGSGI
jgi:hypothetical protein